MQSVLNKINNKWVRLSIMLTVTINTIASIINKPLVPFNNEEIAIGVSVMFLVVSNIWNHWMNNSYTDKAIRADSYLNSMK
ncbi:phage holin [Virgibacillus salexigens]|uniref:Phage holin n=1 Tax=Virgibacillus kapii TaxID=1638645 RepID=A0ABQ2DXC7_9BACI|nr:MULTISPECIES: phage holin [Virgibacillus]MYL43938.1 hypothetical protein [Virgibacillus massiliensis]GGJ77053.1 hypothetical protein GCM10007111_43390 [Virgibacillus kapii]